MDALTLLNEHIDVDLILRYYDFDKVSGDNHFARACCKIHGGNNASAFVINKENGLWYCHTGGCGGGDVYTLVELLEGVNFPQAVQKVAEILHIDLGTLQIRERQAHSVEELKKWIATIRSLNKKNSIAEYIVPEEQRDVKAYRGFKKETLDYFGLKYVEKIDLKKKDGKPYTLHNRLLFPIMYKGKQVAVSLRRIKNTDVPKWSHQPSSFETSKLLYNYDNVQGCDTIVICEGFLDVWAYHEIGVSAVATFGAHLTDEQYKLLLKTGANIVLSYDGDDAGREATRKSREMLLFKANIYVVNFEEGQDPASIPREELKRKLLNKRRV